MKLMVRCLNLEIVELNLSLNYGILINQAVDFGVRNKLGIFNLCERRGAHSSRLEGRGAHKKKLIVGN